MKSLFRNHAFISFTSLFLLLFLFSMACSSVLPANSTSNSSSNEEAVHAKETNEALQLTIAFQESQQAELQETQSALQTQAQQNQQNPANQQDPNNQQNPQNSNETKESPTLTNTVQQPPRPTLTETMPSASGNNLDVTGEVSIDNQSQFAICEIYYSLSSSPAWGANLIIDPVPPGEDFVLTGIDQGEYDIKVVSCMGDILLEDYNYLYPPYESFIIGDPVPPAAFCGDGICDQNEDNYNCPEDCMGSYPNGSTPMTIINNTDNTICMVLMGLPESEWAYELLGGNFIEPRSNRVVYVDDNDWALLAQDCMGNTIKFSDRFTVSGPTGWTIAP